MDRKLYIKETIVDLSLEMGDILVYNEQDEMFEMNKQYSTAGPNYSTKSSTVVKIDYTTALDLIEDDKASMEEDRITVENEDAKEFEKVYDELETLLGIEGLNERLTRIEAKLAKLDK
jgi:hypothetical protein